MSRHTDSIRAAAELGYRVTPEGVCLGPSGKPRRPYVAPNKPYGLITFCLQGRWAKFYVHKMAAFQLFGEAALQPGTHVRHLDGNSLNNAASNLAIGTASDNAWDKPPEVRRRAALQAARKRSKLTPEQARKLVLLSMQGKTGRWLAQHFGILKSTVSEILQGKLYSDVTGLTPVPRTPKRESEAA